MVEAELEVLEVLETVLEELEVLEAVLEADLEALEVLEEWTVALLLIDSPPAKAANSD